MAVSTAESLEEAFLQQRTIMGGFHDLPLEKALIITAESLLITK